MALKPGDICAGGHLFDGKNVMYSGGYYKCLQCARERAAFKKSRKGIISQTSKPEIKRFLSKVQKGLTDDDCWLWLASLNNMGYPRFSLADGSHILAHRFSYQHYIGPLEKHLQVDHMCNVPRCVNPKHLQKVTNRQNTILAYRRRKYNKSIDKG